MGAWPTPSLPLLARSRAAAGRAARAAKGSAMQALRAAETASACADAMLVHDEQAQRAQTRV